MEFPKTWATIHKNREDSVIKTFTSIFISTRDFNEIHIVVQYYIEKAEKADQISGFFSLRLKMFE